MTSGLGLARTGRIPAISWISTTITLHPLTRRRPADGAAVTPKTVLVFPDRGLRCRQAAAEMLDTATMFADHMHCCDAAFADFVNWSLFDMLRCKTAPSSSDIARPVVFAIAVSLAKQWQALGMRPDAVLGDNLGEVAAAYIAEALSLADAAKVVALRSRAVSAIEAVDSAYAAAAQADTWTQTLRGQLSSVDPRTAGVAFISTVTGAGLDTSILDGDYWSANLGRPALFEHAVRWASDHGYRTFIEASPRPALTPRILKSLGDRTVDA